MNDSTSQVFTASSIVSDHPVLLHTVNIDLSSAGKYVKLYDGRDANSGDYRWYTEGQTNVVNQISFTPPLPFKRGLYVELESGVNLVSIHYTVLPFTPQLKPES